MRSTLYKESNHTTMNYVFKRNQSYKGQEEPVRSGLSQFYYEKVVN